MENGLESFELNQISYHMNLKVEEVRNYIYQSLNPDTLNIWSCIEHLVSKDLDKIVLGIKYKVSNCWQFTELHSNVGHFSNFNLSPG